MNIDRHSGVTVFHNRRFARRNVGSSTAPSSVTSVNRRPFRSEPLRPIHVAEQSAVLPSAQPAGNPIDDARFVAECAEGILNSLSNAIIALDETGRVKTVNAAAMSMLGVAAADIVGRPAAALFVGANAWLQDRVAMVQDTHEHSVTRGADVVFGARTLTVNATIFPLIASDGAEALGTMIMLDDISAQSRMKSTMAHYLDPTVVDRLLSADCDRLEGEDTIATVLFADVRGFTHLTEEMGAQQAVKLLNEYFSLMVECITAEGGMVDKFIGDAIMAGFGVNQKHDDDEDRAVRAGIAMLKKLDKWNAERVAAGQQPIAIGIGMTTDTVVSGTIGSATRMDYTLIGDGVNLASRLEGACKHYEARFLISEQTFKKLKGSYNIREIDEVIVHGKSQPVRVYEVLDHHTPVSFPKMNQALAKFAAARAHYVAGDWETATAAFWDVLALNPNDHLATHYIDRCEQLKLCPPREWTGVWSLETK
jgi:adenylate cyclase